MKFKEGDVVFVTKQILYRAGECCGDYTVKELMGEIGVVEYSCHGSEFCISVIFYKDKFNDYEGKNGKSCNLLFRENEITKALKSTKLSKKLYPNWEEKDGWLYPKNN